MNIAEGMTPSFLSTPLSNSRKCARCLNVLELDQFMTGKNYCWCKPCYRKYHREWYHRNKEKVADGQRKRHAANPAKYQALRRLRTRGVTQQQYESMLQAQRGVCAICSRPETRKQCGKVAPLCVDHDHKTQQVRSLLCARCNSAIGLLFDDPVLLAKAALYLQQHKDLP